MPQVLITGGAGFIGSHVADHLLAAGYRVRVFDNGALQVHGPLAGPPAYLSPAVDYVRGDIRNGAALERALRGVDAVLHLAAMVGVGQSMYEVERYTAVNELGTATLMQALLERPVGRLVVASSMSVYGEGRYLTGDGEVCDGAERDAVRIRAGDWEPTDRAGGPLRAIATPEEKMPSLRSVYALNKYVQERMSLLIGEAYGIPTIALRFFNVYGTRQALSNPYTGVLAIFAARLLNGNRPRVFEDGAQRRDFVHVSDVARACRLALEAPSDVRGVFNIGSGESRTIREVARQLASTMGRPELAPEIMRRYRTGDVRHCFADIGRARAALGFEPQMAFEDGLEELATWLADATAIDRVDEATEELARRGLVA
ncbi:MAG TPA: SDR family NAD(P)-dependent oxidoreductase [Geminicoccaceae bacterium]